MDKTKSNNISFSNKTLLQYVNGELSSADAHEIEKAALMDPFLAEALEGLEKSQKPSQSVQSIQAKLQGRRPAYQRILLVAASIALLATITISLFQNSTWKKEEAIAYQDHLATSEPENDQTASNQVPSPAEQLVPEQNEGDIALQEETSSMEPNTDSQIGQAIEIPQQDSSRTNPSGNLSFLVTKKITGIVLSEDQRPIAGVVIETNDTEVGTLTNDKGEFEIVVPESADLLTFYSAGFEPQQHDIKDGENIDITLAKDAEENYAYNIESKNNNSTSAGYLPARPIDGYREFNKYLNKLKKDLKKKGVLGTLEYTIQLNALGQIIGVQTNKGADSAVNKKVIEYLKKGPLWSPAVSGSTNVASDEKITLEIK